MDARPKAANRRELLDLLDGLPVVAFLAGEYVVAVPTPPAPCVRVVSERLPLPAEDGEQ